MVLVDAKQQPPSSPPAPTLRDRMEKENLPKKHKSRLFKRASSRDSLTDAKVAARLQSRHDRHFDRERREIQEQRLRLAKEKAELERRRKQLEQKAQNTVNDILHKQNSDIRAAKGGAPSRSSKASFRAWEKAWAEKVYGMKGQMPNIDAADWENDQRFKYWQSFWTKVQELRQKFHDTQQGKKGGDTEPFAVPVVGLRTRGMHPRRGRHVKSNETLFRQRPSRSTKGTTEDDPTSQPLPRSRTESHLHKKRSARAGSSSNTRGRATRKDSARDLHSRLRSQQAGLRAQAGARARASSSSTADSDGSARYQRGYKFGSTSSASSSKPAAATSGTERRYFTRGNSSRTLDKDDDSSAPQKAPAASLYRQNSMPFPPRRTRMERRHAAARKAQAAKAKGGVPKSKSQQSSLGSGGGAKQPSSRPSAKNNADRAFGGMAAGWGAAQGGKRKDSAGKREKTTQSKAKDTKGKDDGLSNVQRFFREEARRKAKAEALKRKAQQEIDEKSHARRLWQKLQADVDAKWSKYEKKAGSDDANNTASPAPNVSARERQPYPPRPQPTNTRARAWAAPKHPAPRSPSAAAAATASKFTPPTHAPMRRRPSTYTSTAAAGSAEVTVRASISAMSVRELKQQLARHGSNASAAAVVEKSDLCVLVEKVFRAKEEEAQQQKKEKAKEKTRDRIVKEVVQWSKGKSIKKMLNEINSAKTGDSYYLKRFCAFEVVSKAYKRALLKVHPDKHMNDFEAHVRATEMFKEVNAKYNQYRARNNKKRK